MFRYCDFKRWSLLISKAFRYHLDRSVLEVLNERLIIEVGPVVDLDLFVEWLELLLDLILGGGDHELVLGCTDVRGVHNEQNLGFHSSVVGGVLDFEHTISILESGVRGCC